MARMRKHTNQGRIEKHLNERYRKAAARERDNRSAFNKSKPADANASPDDLPSREEMIRLVGHGTTGLRRFGNDPKLLRMVEALLND